MGNTAIDQFEKGVVVPLDLRCGLFTTAVVDNVDVNPKLSTAMTAFHATAASLNQHISDKNSGRARDVPSFLSSEKKLKLPEKYTNIKPLHLPSTVPYARKYNKAQLYLMI